MKFKVLTLFPEMFPGPLSFSVIGKALDKRLFELDLINYRDFSKNKTKRVDHTPFGGGPGMIIKPDILQDCLSFAQNKKLKTKVLSFSASGKKINHKFIKDLTSYNELILVCGRYEGIDQRFIDYNKIEEISVGDFIISGGELAAFILIDACVRLIPEVLGNNNSLSSESFQDDLLEYSQYTKPLRWKNMEVPEVLLSGDHRKILDWRLKNSLEKTKKRRPDLLKLYLDKKREK